MYTLYPATSPTCKPFPCRVLAMPRGFSLSFDGAQALLWRCLPCRDLCQPRCHTPEPLANHTCKPCSRQHCVLLCCAFPVPVLWAEVNQAHAHTVPSRQPVPTASSCKPYLFFCPLPSLPHASLFSSTKFKSIPVAVQNYPCWPGSVS